MVNFIRRLLPTRAPAIRTPVDRDAPIALYFEPSGRVRPITLKSGVGGWTDNEYNALNASMVRGGNGTAGPSELGYAYISEVNVWVKRCIDIRASTLSRLDWSVKDIRTGKLLDDHPLAIAMMRSKRLIKRSQRALDIWGELYLKPLANDFGYYSDIWWLNNLSVTLTIVNGYVTDFYYMPLHGGKPHQWPAREMCYIYTENAFDDLRGASKILSVLQEANVHEEIARSAQAHFANDARPGIMFIPEQDMGTGPAQEFLDYWKANFQGSLNVNKPVMLPMAIRDVKTLERADLKSDIEMRGTIRREICAGFGVPLSVAGAWDDANYQSAPEQRKSLYEETIIPLADDLAADFNRDLMPFFDDSHTCEVVYDARNLLALAEDKQAKATALNSQLMSGGLTLNQYREALDMEAIPQGNVFYVPSGVIVTPVEKLGTMPPPMAPSPFGMSTASGDVSLVPAESLLPEATPADNPPITADTAAQRVSACVLLSLSDNVDLVALQGTLKGKLVDTPVEWVSPDDFHITLVYLPACDEATLQRLLEYLTAYPTPIFDLNIGSLASFDSLTEHAIHFRIRRDAALEAYQEDVYLACQQLGLATSQYSAPNNWKPHITMGYAQDRVAPVTYHTPLRVSPREVQVSVDRGGVYDIVGRYLCGQGSDEAPATAPADPPVDPHMLSVDTGDTDDAPIGPASTARSAVDEALDELNAYEKFVLNRWGKAKRAFDFHVLDDLQRSDLSAAVNACADKAQVKRLFESMRAKIQPIMAEWSEGDHPRDENGQFSDGGSGGNHSEERPSSDDKKPSTPKPNKKPKPIQPKPDGNVSEGKPAWAGENRGIARDPDGYIDYGHIDGNPTNVMGDMRSESMSQTHVSALQDEQKRAAKTYTGETYQDINGGLRNGNLDPSHESTVRDLDSAIEKSRLPENTVLYRGVTMNDALREKVKPGATFKDNAYTSTSLDQGNPDRFSGGDDGAVMRIKAPKDQPGLALQSLSDYPEEKEVLLPRGTSYRITSVHVDPATKRTYIDAEIVPEGLS